MKQLLVGVLMFGLALGGASALSIMKAKGAAAVASAEGAAEGAGTDESTGEDTAGDAGKELPPEPDSPSMGAHSTGPGPEGEDPSSAGEAASRFAAVDLAGDAANPGADVAGDGAQGADAAGTADTGPVSDLNPEGIRRMARIFGAMKPQEAAAVLQRMSDEEVRGVMLQMGDRPAAAILSVFDPDRAAALSRVVLGRRGAP